MGEPRVSVICIFLDGERFMREAVESVLAQDFPDFELLLVDDGSTDASSAIARDYARKQPGQVRYLEHPAHANLGMSAARNLGLSVARGELVAFIDCDDVWRPAKLGEQVEILEAHREVGMVCGTVNYWRSWQGGKDRLVATGHRLDTPSPPPSALLALYPLGTVDAPCPSDVMLRRALVEEVEGFEDQFTGLYEDIVFFSKVFSVATVWFSSRVWIDYRQHAASSSSAVTRELYRAARRRYFDWFAGFLARKGMSDDPVIARAIDRGRWELAHPWPARVRRLARTLVRRFINR